MPKITQPSPRPWKFIADIQTALAERREYGDIVADDGTLIATVGHEGRRGGWHVNPIDKANAELIVRLVNGGE